LALVSENLDGLQVAAQAQRPRLAVWEAMAEVAMVALLHKRAPLIPVEVVAGEQYL
jgi:hypothetical protein